MVRGGGEMGGVVLERRRDRREKGKGTYKWRSGAGIKEGWKGEGEGNLQMER